MTRTLTVIGVDDSGFNRVRNAINAEFEDRNLIGNLDGMDASFDVCVADAAAKLGGVWDMTRTGTSDDYFVALDGAPLSAIKKDID